MEEDNELINSGPNRPNSVSLSRQQEMKASQDSQKEFHGLLKEYMCTCSFALSINCFRKG